MSGAAATVPAAPRSRRRTLHVARSLTEACLGAAAEGASGFLVSVYGGSEDPMAKTAEITAFGPVVRTHGDGDLSTIRRIVLDTLATGFKDVWLSCGSADLAIGIAEAAREAGHLVKRPAGQLPDAMPDPYLVFAKRRDLGVSDGRPVLSFCKMDVETREPLGVGYTLSIGCGPATSGGTEVWYQDAMGNRLAPHGTLPRELTPDEQARLRRVQARVEQTNLGRGWLEGRVAAYQILVFHIPSEIAVLLADAKLVEPWGGKRGTRAEE